MCLCLVPGCARTERVKTVVLPKPVKAQETEDDRADGYQVKKIYTWEYAAPTPQSVSLLECGEHEIRLARVAEDGTGIRFDRLDYRYGFYEDYAGMDRKRLAIYDRDSEEKKQFMRNALSPDGRCLLWLEEELGFPAVKMYLNNLETGVDELLLDGYALNLSEEEYFPLTAWSRDGKYLAYCFYPRSWDIFRRDETVPVKLFSLETKKIVEQYYFVPGEMPDGDSAKMYLDVADGKAVIVIALKQTKDPEIRLEICRLGIGGKPEEEQFVNYSSTLMESGGTVYPDAKADRVYVGQAFDRIYNINGIELETGEYNKNALVEAGTVNEEVFDASQVLEFIVLDEGETVITTEKAETGHDICIYQQKDGTWERRILYHYNAGSLYFLQYDEKNHRLLAVSSAYYVYGVNQTAIILEF